MLPPLWTYDDTIEATDNKKGVVWFTENKIPPKICQKQTPNTEYLHSGMLHVLQGGIQQD